MGQSDDYESNGVSKESFLDEHYYYQKSFKHWKVWNLLLIANLIGMLILHVNLDSIPADCFRNMRFQTIIIPTEDNSNSQFNMNVRFYVLLHMILKLICLFKLGKLSYGNSLHVNEFIYYYFINIFGDWIFSLIMLPLIAYPTVSCNNIKYQELSVFSGAITYQLGFIGSVSLFLGCVYTMMKKDEMYRRAMNTPVLTALKAFLIIVTIFAYLFECIGYILCSGRRDVGRSYDGHTVTVYYVEEKCEGCGTIFLYIFLIGFSYFMAVESTTIMFVKAFYPYIVFFSLNLLLTAINYYLLKKLQKQNDYLNQLEQSQQVQTQQQQQTQICYEEQTTYYYTSN